MNALTHVRADLLELHRTVLDAAQREYERDRGRLRDTEFLAALVDEAEFAWLKPLTTLVARIDEAPQDETRGQSAKDLIARLRTLLASDSGDADFQRKYADILQRSPDALVAHVRTLRALHA
ncbi:MAG: hypothetical protein ACREU7_08495 [Burkholderiales bacterium]